MLKPMRKYSSRAWLVSTNFESASRARVILSPPIEPDTSKTMPSETGASSSEKKVISCSVLSSMMVKAFLLSPVTKRP